MTKQLRKFDKIPIFIVENHNDVLIFIYRCLASRHLQFENNKIMHFDSHPDLTISNEIPAATVYDKDELLDAVSIENWLMPSVYAGHFRDLIWIKPSWSHQIANGTHQFHIGDYNGLIRVDAQLEYFISEGSYRPMGDLNNRKPVHLKVFTLNEHVGSSDCDSTRLTAVNDFVKPDESFVLDIDLDFFSTRNPFKGIFNRGTIFNDLRSIYQYEFCDENASEAEYLECTVRRLQQLSDLEKVFNQLHSHGQLDDFQWPPDLKANNGQLLKLIDNIRENYSADEIDWKLVHSAGCTFDSTDLPHHESTQSQIDDLMQQFKLFLENIQIPPTIITISRSSEDDYCPVHQVDGIQGMVLDILGAVYKDKLAAKPIFYYLDDA